MIPATTRVVRIHEFGDASGLKIEDVATPEPGAGEVLIEVHALGLNRAEIMLRTNTYLEQPNLPSRIGYEAAGTVLKTGEGVVGFAQGDRVATVPGSSMERYGVYAEHAVVPAAVLARIPASFSFEQGASIWMQYVTAYGGLFDVGELEARKTVVVTAAASSVGIAALQLARMSGARVIATTRNDDKIQTLLEHGADVVINTESESLAERVMAITNGVGADLVFDPIAGSMLAEAAEAAANRGTIVVYGALGDGATPFPLLPALAKGLTVRGYTLFEVSKDAKRLADIISDLIMAFEHEDLRPVIDERRFALDDIAEAQRYMESNEHIGKIVVNVRNAAA